MRLNVHTFITGVCFHESNLRVASKYVETLNFINDHVFDLGRKQKSMAKGGFAGPSAYPESTASPSTPR